MKAYTFKVIVERDEKRWHAYCPALEAQGASTWGHTREEALKHINEVVQLVVESMIEHGEPLPEADSHDVHVTASGDTFAPKTLKSMIEKQARWSEEDLKRLKLLR